MSSSLPEPLFQRFNDRDDLDVLNYLDGALYSRGWMDGLEDREEYKHGGFHPVHLGDHLGKDTRYRVIHKLGNGGLATVWLCRDCEINKYVALKIIRADASGHDCAELKLVRRKDLDFDQAGGRHIVLPLDYFWIEGPNGSHLCLVLPVLGPRVDIIWTAFGRFPDPDKTARSIALQVATGLQFLHRNGICHGDFRPSNILLRLSDFDSLSEEQIATEFGEPLKDPLLTISGEIPGPSAPKYTVKPIDLEALDSRHLTDQACIIDFGESYELSSPPEGLGIPSAYCSPELIFDSSVGVASDIWAFACTLYEIRSMRTLFESFNGDDDEILLQMVKLLGRLPDPWWVSWDPRDRWFNEDGTPRVNPETGKAFVNCFTIPELLSDGIHFTITATGRSVDIVVPADERDILAELLLGMLKYDPQIARYY